MSALLGRLLAALAIVFRVIFGRRADELPGPEPDPRRRELPGGRGELVAAALLGLSALGAVAFVVFYVVHADTQLLGAGAGLALAFLAAALLVASLRVVPQVTEVEERPSMPHPQDRGPVRDELRAGVEGVSRRKLLAAAGGAAAAGVGAVVAVPVASLGPRVDGRLAESPWQRGVVLVDDENRPVAASSIVVGELVTAFPEGADKRELGSPVVVVRVDPATLRLPAGRRDWAPGGLVAYSKICTHAGCAVSEYRWPLYQPTSKSPGLVCPCHYSTFDPRRAGAVTFGPAGRPLPQLPLLVDASGVLRAAGALSAPVGPAWWGVS